jgi:hypothetical protein
MTWKTEGEMKENEENGRVIRPMEMKVYQVEYNVVP